MLRAVHHRVEKQALRIERVDSLGRRQGAGPSQHLRLRQPPVRRGDPGVDLHEDALERHRGEVVRRRRPRVGSAAKSELEQPPPEGRPAVGADVEVDVTGGARRNRLPFLASPERERHPLQQDTPRADRAETGLHLPEHVPLHQLADPLAHRRCPQRLREEGGRPARELRIAQRGHERPGQPARRQVRRPALPVDVRPGEDPRGLVRPPRPGLRRGPEEDPGGPRPVDVPGVELSPPPAVLDHEPRGPPLRGEPRVHEAPSQRRDGVRVGRDVEAQVTDAEIARPEREALEAGERPQLVSQAGRPRRADRVEDRVLTMTLQQRPERLGPERADDQGRRFRREVGRPVARRQAAVVGHRRNRARGAEAVHRAAHRLGRQAARPADRLEPVESQPRAAKALERRDQRGEPVFPRRPGRHDQADPDGQARLLGGAGDEERRGRALELVVVAVDADGQRTEASPPERPDAVPRPGGGAPPGSVRRQRRGDAEPARRPDEPQDGPGAEHRLPARQVDRPDVAGGRLTDTVEELLLRRLVTDVGAALHAAVAASHVAAARHHECHRRGRRERLHSHAGRAHARARDPTSASTASAIRESGPRPRSKAGTRSARGARIRMASPSVRRDRWFV